MSLDEDVFMNRFNQRLSLEPPPAWTKKRRPLPWQEIAWAGAAALMLGVYWKELSFAAVLASEYVRKWPVPVLYMVLAGLTGAFFVLKPKLKLEV